MQVQERVRVGDYVVAADSEQFRIFPKGKDGKTVPVWRVNHFLYLRHVNGDLVVFKRYLHMKRWYWRDSRDSKPCTESAVVTEVARMLFQGDAGQAQDLLVRMLLGGSLAQAA